MEEEANKNVEKTYTDPITGKFIPGNPGGGRPKGSFSLMTRIKKLLEENPEKTQELVDYYINDEAMRPLLLQMIDGRPKQDHDVDLGFKPIPLDDVHKDEIISEDQSPKEET